MVLPGAHAAGLPVEEMAPAILTGGSMLAMGLYRAVRAWLSACRSK